MTDVYDLDETGVSKDPMPNNNQYIMMPKRKPPPNLLDPKQIGKQANDTRYNFLSKDTAIKNSHIPSTDSNEHCLNYKIAKAILQNSYKNMSYKEFADFLGQKSNNSILKEYIQLLKPLPISLANLLTSLSTKLYFIAEAQNIDRILEEASKQWTLEYPDTIWGSNYKICHIILFSLLILNSNLHNDNYLGGKQSKFSSKTFIENTFYAIEKEISRNREDNDINLDSIKSEASEEFAAYYDLSKNHPLPLFNAKNIKHQSRHSNTPSRSSSFRKNRVIKMSSLDSDSLSDLDTSLSIPTRSRSDSRSLNLTTTLSRSDSISSSKTNTSTFSRTTASWKYQHHQPLPQLYIKEDFDQNLNKKNGTFWLVDSVIRINELDLIKLQNRNKKLISNEYSSKNAMDSTALSIGPSSSSLKPHTKSLFRWLRKSKEKTLFQDSGKSMTYLDNTCRWVRARIRISEGRIFIFRLNPCQNRVSSAKSVYSIKQKPFSATSRLFSSASALSLPLTHSKNKDKKSVISDSSSTNCLVFNLFECFADLVQDNIITGNQSSTANFTLAFPRNLNGIQITLEFETVHVNEAQTFVQCLNFWAGRLTPVPVQQFEVVSNEEYGWSTRVLDNLQVNLSKVRLCDWKPLLTFELFYDHMDEIPGKIPLFDKIEELQSFTTKLDELIDEHNTLKPRIIKLWENSVEFEKVLDNWNEKYLFLNIQYKKRIIYLTNLETAVEQLH